MYFGVGKKKVLIIDDDPTLQRQLHVRLEMHEKVTVIKAMDGENGLAQASSKNPDLIILDWMLPGIQGIEVLERLRRASKTKITPVLMLTGRDTVGNIEDAFDIGANAYLAKPVSLQKVGEKVIELLNLPSLEQVSEK